MHTKIRWLALASTLFVVWGTVTAQKAQDARSSSDVQRVVRKYAAALGGQARVMNIRTREIHGTFEYKGIEQHATGQLEMRWRSPSSLVEQLRGPMGVIARGFDGARAWGNHPQAGVRQLSSFEIDEIILDGVRRHSD